jgi:hypothetical protein
MELQEQSRGRVRRMPALESRVLRSSAVLAALLFMPCIGCYSTWDIAPRELIKLDGYRAPAAATIVDKRGHQVEVDPKTELLFITVNKIPVVEARFTSIDVREAPKEWWLSGVLHGDGTAIRVDLNQIGRVKATRFSPGKTAVVVVVPVVATGIFIGLVVGVILPAMFRGIGD